MPVSTYRRPHIETSEKHIETSETSYRKKKKKNLFYFSFLININLMEKK